MVWSSINVCCCSGELALTAAWSFAVNLKLRARGLDGITGETCILSSREGASRHEDSHLTFVDLPAVLGQNEDDMKSNFACDDDDAATKQTQGATPSSSQLIILLGTECCINTSQKEEKMFALRHDCMISPATTNSCRPVTELK